MFGSSGFGSFGGGMSYMGGSSSFNPMAGAWAPPNAATGGVAPRAPMLPNYQPRAPMFPSYPPGLLGGQMEANYAANQMQPMMSSGMGLSPVQMGMGGPMYQDAPTGNLQPKMSDPANIMARQQNAAMLAQPMTQGFPAPVQAMPANPLIRGAPRGGASRSQRMLRR